MKRLILFLSLIFSVSALFCAPVADSLYEQTKTVISENPFDGIFETFFALVAFIPFVVQFLRTLLFPKATGIAVQIFSWVVGLAITLTGWALNLGFLAGLSIWLAILYGIGASLAANGVYDTGLITAIFKLLGIKKGF